MGALIAVEFCQDPGLLELILEGDSQLFVRANNDRSTDCQYGQVVNDIHVGSTSLSKMVGGTC